MVLLHSLDTSPDRCPAVSAGDYANLNLFEQFAAAAYCPSNNNVQAGGVKISCSTGNCPLVSNDDVVAVYEFQKYVVYLNPSERICLRALD